MPAQEMPSLPKESSEVIQHLIQRKFEADDLNTSFPNPLLREDVLALLDRYCTVVYYPLEDEKNNGFHIKIPDISGKERHFVYINTAQTIEKQAFTAAHELGHIWKVDQHVAEQCGLLLDEELGERIINRFAAELLIPEGWFRRLYLQEYRRWQRSDGKIIVRDMFKVIVALMDQFFAPAKSIIYRCWELEYIGGPGCELLLGENPKLPKRIIDSVIQEIIRDNGYTQFQTPTKKRSINGLAELLNRAEAQGRVSQGKIEHLRALFDLRPPVTDEQIDELLN